MDAYTISALVIVIIFWASAFAGIRVGLSGYPPFELALLRFLVASTALFIYGIFVQLRLPHGRDIPVLALLGFLGFTVYHFALNYGEQTVSAGSASMLIAAGPIFTALLASAFLGEHLNIWGWAGIFLGFSGVALIAIDEGGGLGFDPGAFCILLAAISTSLYFVFQKPLHAKYSPLELTTYTLWAGTFLMLPFAPNLIRLLRHASPAATWSVVYLGLGPAALAYVFWNFSLSRLPASRVTSFLYISPVVAVLIAWLWLGEVPTLLTTIGGVVALSGVIITNVWGRTKAQVDIS